MNDKEIFHLGTIRDVYEQRIKRKDAAQLLNISVRLVQRLLELWVWFINVADNHP